MLVMITFLERRDLSEGAAALLAHRPAAPCREGAPDHASRRTAPNAACRCHSMQPFFRQVQVCIAGMMSSPGKA